MPAHHHSKAPAKIPRVSQGTPILLLSAALASSNAKGDTVPP